MPERADPSASDAAREPGAPERPLHRCTEGRAASNPVGSGEAYSKQQMLVIKVARLPRARCGLTISVRRISSEVPAAAPPAKDRPRMKPPQVAKPFEEVTMEEVRAALESKSTPTEDKRAAADEIGGPKGEEPTRFGDWERKGRVTDF